MTGEITSLSPQRFQGETTHVSVSLEVKVKVGYCKEVHSSIGRRQEWARVECVILENGIIQPGIDETSKVEAQSATIFHLGTSYTRDWRREGMSRRIF